MSYMNYPRLTFNGKFQADTSTVNNDPRHFDVNDFESRFQNLQVTNKPEKGDIQFNGWWQPNGMGTFRLVDCKPELFLGPDGNKIETPALKAIEVGNSLNKPSAKIVDLDTDWQLASSIYGQVITLINPESGELLMSGDFEVNAFRDLWFTRSYENGGDSAASAIFQSVLTNLSWGTSISNYSFLQELRDSTQEGMLSIRLTTYGFNGSYGTLGYTYGIVQGVIGPYNSMEPHSFINGRRFAPLQGEGSSTIDPKYLNPDIPKPGQNKTIGISNFSFIVDEEAQTMEVDTSNALPSGKEFESIDLPDFYFVLLKNDGFAEDQKLTSDDYVEIGAIDSSNQLRIEGGIQRLKIPVNAMSLIKDHSIALIKKVGVDSAIIIIREEPDGVTLRAENFTFRLDPNSPDENVATTTFYASKYGKPFVGANIEIVPFAPWRDVDGGPDDKPDTTTPKAPIPTLNKPIDVINIASRLTVTGNDGIAKVVLQGPSEMHNPRGYIDGQLYCLNYNFTNSVQTVPQQFDGIFILVFNTFAPTNNPPEWRDIQPILQQYANLYPVMSKWLFDFSKQEIADANAESMLFAFSKDIKDPGYMPVTRDLSSAKKKALITYFDNVIKNRKGESSDTYKRFVKRCPMHGGQEPLSANNEIAGESNIPYGKVRPR